jgi:hypothetical protein
VPDLDCRVAKLEERVDQVADMDAKLDAILASQHRQRGFIAGVSITVGAIASAVTLFFTAHPPR